MKWIKQHWYVLPLAVVMLFVLPPVAKADVADIIAFLQTITSTLQGDIGNTLNLTQQLKTDMANFHQHFIWPMASLNGISSFISTSEGQMGPILSGIENTSVNSATLAGPSQLENVLRSADIVNLDQTSPRYMSVFGPLPSTADAPIAERNIMDMDDASSLDALKTAIISDQTSTRMSSLADSLAQQAASSAPGSAPIIATQAQIASLENQALLVKTLAAELRVEATRLAHDNALLKKSAQHTAILKQTLQQMTTYP